LYAGGLLQQQPQQQQSMFDQKPQILQAQQQQPQQRVLPLPEPPTGILPSLSKPMFSFNYTTR
jgi:hypothetical protein